MKYLKILLIICLFSITASANTDSFDKIMKNILYLEDRGIFTEDEKKINTEILTWAIQSEDLVLNVKPPFELDTTYQYNRYILMGFSYGVLYYGLENFDKFDEKDIIEFNTHAYLNGCVSIIKTYEQIIRKKGDAAKNPTIEAFIASLKNPDHRKNAEKFVVNEYEKNGAKGILIYINNKQ